MREAQNLRLRTGEEARFEGCTAYPISYNDVVSAAGVVTGGLALQPVSGYVVDRLHHGGDSYEDSTVQR